MLLFWSVPSRALDPSRPIHQYVIDSWKTANGLPQNSVTSVFQTADGYLWLGTYDGLARFDGLNFVAYNLVELVQAPTQVVVAITSCKSGGFYIATTGSVAHWNQGQFTALPTGTFIESTIQAIHEGHDGSVWIGTKNNGLFRFFQGKISSFTSRQGLPSDNVRSVLEDRSGRLWVGTEKGLTFWHDGKWTTLGIQEGLENDYVLSLHEDFSRKLWIGTRGGGLYIFKEGHFEHIPIEGNVDQNTITALTSDEKGVLWLATLDGFHRFYQGKIETFAQPEGLSFSSLRTLAVDREGNLWLGSNGAGLYRIKDSRFTVYTVRNGLSHNTIMGVYGDKQGNLWVGTNCGGLNRFQNGRFTSFTTKDGLSSDCIWSVYGDGQDRIWTATFSSGLNCLDQGKITTWTTRQGLLSNEVRSFYLDRHQALWIGTRIGINRLEGNKITTVSELAALAGRDIRSLGEDRQGSLWIGTNGSGLFRYKDGKVTAYGRESGLSNNSVLSLYGDVEGILWIGTNGGGLNRFQDGRFYTYSVKDGLPSGNIFQILEDSFGNLWISYPQGIFRISRTQLNEYALGKIASLYTINYGRADGLSENGCQGGVQPAGWKDEKGILWFPTMDGLVAIDPSQNTVNTVLPLLSIEKAIINGNPTFTTGQKVIPPGEGRLEFHYSGLSLQASEKVLFRYQLEGFDPGWIHAGATRVAYYTNIPPGEYTFRVTACNNDGLWNNQGTAFTFRLQPHFYQTKTFYALCMVALATAIGSLFWWRGQQHAVQQRHLQEQIHQAMAQIKILSGRLSICASCKKIRDEQNQWRPLETFITDRSQATFSHGICPECMLKLYPEYSEKKDDQAV